MDHGLALAGAYLDDVNGMVQRAVHLAQDRQRPRVQHPGQFGVSTRTEVAATVHRMYVLDGQ